MDQTTEQKNLLLTDVLADVSRAFYLSIWVLPSSVREPIGVAYLLARAAIPSIKVETTSKASC